MPPRIPVQCPQWASFGLPTRPRIDAQSLPFRSFSTSKTRTTWYADTYIRQQKKAHEAATRSRKRKVTVKETRRAGDDPVRGMTTAFVKAFDEPPPPRIDILTGKAMTQVKSTKEDLLNFRLDKELVAQQLEKSKYLSSPGPVEKADVNLLTVDSYGKDDIPEEVKQKALEEYESKVKAVQEAHDAAHQHATQAIERILRLDMGSSKDRMRVNFDKCIEKFGRHNTDAELLSNRGEEQQIKDRAGKDVGSSEVQIAIMTVKIRNLANFIESRGRKDHHNKRNLRLLVHKRQKMLKYLRRKERGGPRWQHVINTLGLTEATWKGEIVV